MNFAGVEGQTNGTGAFVSRDQLEWQPQSSFEHFRNVVRASAGGNAADLDHRAGRLPLLDAGDARGLRYADHEVILRRHAEKFELRRIELNSR